MKESKWFVGVLVAAAAGLSLTLVVVAIDRGPPRHVTLGQLATKDPAVPPGRVRVSNCVGSTRFGRFLVFPAGHESRYPVVFVLGSAEAGAGTVFAGDCGGIRVTPMTGCPCPGPFVLVTGVVAVIE